MGPVIFSKKKINKSPCRYGNRGNVHDGATASGSQSDTVIGEKEELIGSANGGDPERGGLNSLYCIVFHTVSDDQTGHVLSAVPTMM